MHLKVNGTYVPHAAMPNGFIRACESPSSLACRAATSLGICAAYVAPIMVVVGLVFNSITAWLFLVGLEKRTRQFVFLGCLAIADNLRLTQLVIWQIPAKGIPFLTAGHKYFIITNVSEVGCIFFRFHHTFTGLLMSHTFLLASLDRFFSLRSPNSMSKFGTRSAWIMMAITAVLVTVIATGWASVNGYRSIDSVIFCWIKRDNIYWAISNILFFQARTLQITLINMINIVVIYMVIKILRNRRELQEGQQKRKLQFKQIKASILIFWVAVIDFCANIPMVVTGSLALGMILIGDMENSNKFFAFVDLLVIIADIEACTRWTIYVWRMNEFRVKFTRALTCGVIALDYSSQESQTITGRP